MRLEYALSIGEPRSAMIQAIQSRSTGPSHLTQADVLGALGLVQKYEGVGLALMMALKATAELAVQHYRRTVDTPGAACHPQFCHGRGVIRDLELSRLHGKAVDKVCPRCSGTGLRPISGPQVRRAIEPLLGSLSRGEWELQWYPLYQAVLAWCHVQESKVAAFYKRVTAA